MKRYHPLMLSALLLAGCASPSVEPEGKIQVIQIEPLVGSSVADDSVTIQVISTGCTTKESFISFLDQGEVGYGVTFARQKPDLCRAAPRPLALSWTFDELDLPNGATVTVVNPRGR